MKWMVLGSSPTAAKYCTAVEVDRVVSAGEALTLRRPDVYIIAEINRLHTHEKLKREIRKKGTLIYVSGCIYSHIEKHLDGQYPCDGYLPCVIDNEKHWNRWEPGLYVMTCSGATAVQYAVNHGAEEIHLVGMEGYRGPGEVTYFTGEKGSEQGVKFLREMYAPLMQLIVSSCPEIQFFTYGQMEYDLAGENVTHAVAVAVSR